MGEPKAERIILRVTKETKRKIEEAAKKAKTTETALLREFIKAGLMISDAFVIQTKTINFNGKTENTYKNWK